MMRVSTRAQIANLHHTLKTTTIYVTHDQVEAMTLADRVVVMNKGVAQQVAPPMEIYDRPANTFVASFIGAPAMNLIEGEIANGTFTSPVLRVEGLPHPVSGPVTLGFRAEDASAIKILDRKKFIRSHCEYCIYNRAFTHTLCTNS